MTEQSFYRDKEKICMHASITSLGITKGHFYMRTCQIYSAIHIFLVSFIMARKVFLLLKKYRFSKGEVHRINKRMRISMRYTTCFTNKSLTRHFFLMQMLSLFGIRSHNA